MTPPAEPDDTRVVRVLLVNDGASPHTGGMNRMVVGTCDALSRAGHAVGLVYHDDRAATVDCPTFHVPEDRPLAQRGAALDAAVDTFRPDVVQVHSTRFHAFLPALSRRVPLTTFVHDQSIFCSGGDRMTGSLVPCRRPHGLGCMFWHFAQGCGGKNPAGNWRRWRECSQRSGPRTLRRARFQVASRFMREGLLQNRYPEDQVDVVPLFTEEPVAKAATEPGLLLLPGRLVRGKGTQIALEALARLRSPGVRLAIAGDGPERAALEREAARLGVAGKVSFLGELTPAALGAWYAGAQIVLFPVLRLEPFGLVGVEAMAHGKPIVAFGGGGVDEWLFPGETGLRVEARTAEAFAAALDELLGGPARCGAMGEAARRRFSPFRPEAYVERLGQAFERAIGWFAATAEVAPVVG